MNDFIYKWWDNPVLSLEEYKYFHNNKWWNHNILSLEEYYKIERDRIENKIIKMLFPKLYISTYLPKEW